MKLTEPVDTGVTTPLEFIIATEVFEEFQVIDPEAVVANVILLPIQTAVKPVIAGVDGKAYIVISNGDEMAVQVPLSTVYLIKVVPAETEVITPVVGLIVATPVFDELQVIVPEADVLKSFIVPPTQTSSVPVITGVEGEAFIVKVTAVLVSLEQLEDGSTCSA